MLDKSLCICLTPLHVLISAKIADETQQKFDKGIYFSYNKDVKTNHYFMKMSEFCKETEFVILPNDNIKNKFKYFLIFFQRWVFKFKYGFTFKFENIYVPTSSNVYLLSLIPFFRRATVTTFDDGIVNISYEEIHVKNEMKQTLVSKVFTKLTGVYNNLDDLISISSGHYSIYPNHKNICSNVRYINFITGDKLTNKANKLHRIFIGPPPEAGSDVWELFNEYIIKLKPDEFLPHPRDTNKIAKNVIYSSTDLIAEDYVQNLLKENQSLNIEIYGLQSSALIHLAQFPNVTVRSFVDKNLTNTKLVEILLESKVQLIEK